MTGPLDPQRTLIFLMRDFENTYSEESKKNFQEVISILYKNFSKDALDKIPLDKLDVFSKRIILFNISNQKSEMSQKVAQDIYTYVRTRHFKKTLINLFNILDNIPTSEIPAYIRMILTVVSSEMEDYKFKFDLNDQDHFHVFNTYQEVLYLYEKDQNSTLAIQKLLQLYNDSPNNEKVFFHRDFTRFFFRLKNEEADFNEGEQNKPNL